MIHFRGWTKYLCDQLNVRIMSVYPVQKAWTGMIVLPVQISWTGVDRSYFEILFSQVRLYSDRSTPVGPVLDRVTGPPVH